MLPILNKGKALKPTSKFLFFYFAILVGAKALPLTTTKQLAHLFPSYICDGETIHHCILLCLQSQVFIKKQLVSDEEHCCYFILLLALLERGYTPASNEGTGELIGTLVDCFFMNNLLMHALFLFYTFNEHLGCHTRFSIPVLIVVFDSLSQHHSVFNSVLNVPLIIALHYIIRGLQEHHGC